MRQQAAACPRSSQGAIYAGVLASRHEAISCLNASCCSPCATVCFETTCFAKVVLRAVRNIAHLDNLHLWARGDLAEPCEQGSTVWGRSLSVLSRGSESLRCQLKLVGARGFEPPTSWSQTRRATRLRYAPCLLINPLGRLLQARGARARRASRPARARASGGRGRAAPTRSDGRAGARIERACSGHEYQQTPRDA